jgi:chemotaxis signal transduction protein
MRVFLSDFSGFTLAVPMDAVASIMLYKQEEENPVRHDAENCNTYISLPRLFNLPGEAVCHGIILQQHDSTANKVVLLTSEIMRDIEIPNEEFYPIPKALSGLRFSTVFSGIQLADNPILLLNTEQLIYSIQEEPSA